MKISEIIKREGDYLEFIHTTHGIDVTCIIKRNRLDSLCGYVKLEKWNRFYKGGQWYDQDIEVNVHGGITYWEDGIIGFDCSHIGDLRPKMDPKGAHGTYKDMEFVKGECRKLADQIMELNIDEIRDSKISKIIE